MSLAQEYITFSGVCCACSKPCEVSAMEEDAGRPLAALSTCCWCSAVEDLDSLRVIQLADLEYDAAEDFDDPGWDFDSRGRRTD